MTNHSASSPSAPDFSAPDFRAPNASNQHARSEIVYREFVRELSLTPGRFDLLDRLCSGHLPDEMGWCRHTTHAYHWERYPCAVVRMVEFVDSSPLAPSPRPGSVRPATPRPAPALVDEAVIRPTGT